MLSEYNRYNGKEIIEQSQEKNATLFRVCNIVFKLSSIMSKFQAPVYGAPEKLLLGQRSHISWELCHVNVVSFCLIPFLFCSPILSHCLGGGVITQ